MTRKITIVTYHYVRNILGSAYPKVKGLELSTFERQLDHIAGAYQVITTEDLLQALEDPSSQLPPNACLLTFDDGYKEHSDLVLPRLEARNWQGTFFVPAWPTRQNKVLPINKIHFILASAPSIQELSGDVCDAIDAARAEFDLPSTAEIRDTYAKPGRYDPAEVIFIKRTLELGLPEMLRSRIIDALFAKYVTNDELAFCEELYMNESDIRRMLANGMHIGHHGYSHVRLTTVDEEERVREIDDGLKFLSSMGIDTSKGWVMGYPYGSQDAALYPLISQRGCRMAMTVEPRIADLDADDAFTLPRIDANDLPQ